MKDKKEPVGVIPSLLLRAAAKPQAKRPLIWGQSPEALSQQGCPGHTPTIFRRFQRIWNWHHEKPAIARDAEDFILERFDLGLPAIETLQKSSDGASKLLLKMADGAQVEAVHMPREVRAPRVTYCVSTQVGCQMGCRFCVSGRTFVRDLSAGEIVGQVLVMMQQLGPLQAHRINLVLMGMGEPLANIEAVSRALEIISDQRGLGISPRRITVSTCGHLEGLAVLAKAPYRPELAVSLNAARDEIRSKIMPINRRYSLSQLRQALAQWPLRPHEEILLEYVLLPGINDSTQDAQALIEWVGELSHRINIIPYNEVPGSPYRSPTWDEIQAFLGYLQDRGMRCTLRDSRGKDVNAACGQLRATKAKVQD